MGKFIINGGNELVGELKIQGSKNAALPLLAASLLSDEEVVLCNVPDLIDVQNMCKIMHDLGVTTIKGKEGEIHIRANKADSYTIASPTAKELRSSIFLLGAILSKKKKAIVSYPGGCDIGLRPIDIHIKALKDLGVEIEEKAGYVYCDASKMRPGEVYLEYPSVGATENVILASVKTNGYTILHNAAREPEIVELQNFLNKMGAKITGAGSTKIIIQGKEYLNGTKYTVMPDRIVAGTYLISLLMNGGEIGFKGLKRNHIHSLLCKLPKNSCFLRYNNDIIYIQSQGRPRSVDHITTMPYPGFPTDLQAPFMALQCISDGTCVITENIFENRFHHVPELRKMGADIIIQDRTAIVKGVKELVGAEVYAHDLRGGAALVLAGLVAKGVTVVNDIYHIDRGYERMEETLNKLGANITRI